MSHALLTLGDYISNQQAKANRVEKVYIFGMWRGTEEAHQH